MRHKPEVSITLSCCPRCGWPNDEGGEATPVKAAKTKEPETKWGPRDFGLTPAEFEKHFTADRYERWYSHWFCEREGHKHGPTGVMACWQQRSGGAKDAGKPDPSKPFLNNWHAKICWPGMHTHGEKELLDCVVLHFLAYDMEPPGDTLPASDTQPVPRKRGRPRKSP